MEDPTPAPSYRSLSKRAALRLIQRAFVLAGRDRNVRQHIREAHLSTLWVVEDWNLEWTVVLDRGKLEFERRPAKKPDVTHVWQTATAFFNDVESASRARGWPSSLTHPDGVSSTSGSKRDLRLQKVLEPVYYAFCAALRELLANPVDENGDPLV